MSSKENERQNQENSEDKEKQVVRLDEWNRPTTCLPL